MISRHCEKFISHRYSRFFGGTATLALMAAAFSPAQVHAQEAEEASSSGQLQEIVVVAQKRAENLQDVPIAISAVSGEQLATSGVVSVSALSTAVSGVSINTTAQSFSPHIRGIGTTAFGPGIENPVALVVDDVYYASPLFGFSDVSDVAQVAVLKGPQGTLFGRNATGGVIQLTTREPEDAVGGQLTTSLDNYLTSRNFAYLTGPVSDTLKANLSVKFTTQDEGWGQNIRTGEDIHKIDHDLSLRTKWVWTPTDQTTIKLALDYANQRNSLGANNRPVPGYSTPFSTLDDPGVRNDEWDSDTNITNRNKFEGGGGSLSLTQETGFGSIMSITAYRKYRYQTKFSAAGTTFPVVELYNGDWRGDQFSQEFRMMSDKNQPITWQVGLFYFNASDGFQPLSEELFTNPAAPYSLENNSTFKTESLAWFGQATAEILPDTHITGGIRYTYEKRKAIGFLDFEPLGGGAAPADYPVNEKLTESRFTFRVALDHKFSDHIMGYASFNRGFKSGGFDPFLTQTTPYRAELLDAYELGFKTELFDRTLRLNPSAFFYKYTDIQVSYLVGANAFVDNAANAELYGLEMDVEWQASQALRISGGISYVHNEFTDYPNAPTTVPDPIFILAPGVLTNAKGNNLPYAPELTYNLSIDYKLPLGDNSVDFNFTDAYSSSYASEPDNKLKQKAFHYLNAAATFTDASGRWSIGIWGRNLLNEPVVSQLASYAFLGAIADYANPPRTYGATATFRFGAQ